MTRSVHRYPIVLIALAVFAIAAAASAAVPARAASLGVDIVEPSLIPQTWGYSPNPITVTVGDTITWTNQGVAPHSVTADDGSFDSGVMPTGATWSFTAATPGTYGYFCTLHPDMRSTLIVVSG